MRGEFWGPQVTLQDETEDPGSFLGTIAIWLSDGEKWPPTPAVNLVLALHKHSAPLKRVNEETKAQVGQTLSLPSFYPHILLSSTTWLP